MTALQSDASDESSLASLFVGRTRELELLRSTFHRGRRVVSITGVPGSGKTALVHTFLAKYPDLFSEAVYTYGFGPESPVEALQRHRTLPLRQRTLLVIDEAHRLPDESRAVLERTMRVEKLLHVALVSQEPVPLLRKESTEIVLGPLSTREFRELLAKRLGNVDLDRADYLMREVDGNPAVATLAASSIRDGLVTWDQFLRGLRSFEHPGLVGPDGTPVTSESELPGRLVVDVTKANDEIISMLRSDPVRFRALPPRKFEEIVAELLSRQGYEVELTPASGDGGFDMYAAKSEFLGRFLFLVECKRYTPPHKVGVEIVRSLFGVVQQKRATAGVIATTSFFTTGAQALQREVEHQLHLADYLELQRWLGIL